MTVVASDRRRGTGLAVAAGCLVAVVLALYVGIIAAQGDAEIGRVAVVVTLVAASVGCCFMTPFAHDPGLRAIAAWGGVGELLSLGMLGIFSVGLPLLIAGILLLVAAVQIGVATGMVRLAATACLVGAVVPWVLVLLG
ncbi:MAG: hypothetical protein ABI572_03385 [Actinomycetota bacterium]